MNHSRREFLGNTATGLSSMALAALLQREAAAAERLHHVHHFPPKAKRAINIFSVGGASHIDIFDYKPDLEKYDGKKMPGEAKPDTFFGRPGNLKRSYYEFKRHGQSGQWLSSLLPHLSGCVDDIAFIKSMVTKSSSHTPASFQMNTGFVSNGYPSLGSWLSYGLGTENDQLPTFVVLPDPRGMPAGGSDNWSQGFLPARHQGIPFATGKKDPINFLTTPESVSPDHRALGMDYLARKDRRFADAFPADDALAARVRSYELAARMQTSIPEVVNFDNESEETKDHYGLNSPAFSASARNFLMARRLLERGVRYVQIINGGAFGSPRINWDAHEDVVRNHNNQALQFDQPCAALLKDLKQRGMLDDTLIFWSTEFGRTPFTEAKGNGAGRDHHPHAFTCWMAGAGVKPGMSYGTTDNFGYKVAENKSTVYDFHATILHLLGINHEQLTFYHNGIQRRLTDVHGHVIQDVLA